MQNHKFAARVFGHPHRVPQNGCAISFNQSTHANDEQWRRRRFGGFRQFGQRSSIRANQLIVISEINRLPDKFDFRAFCPSLTNARIQNRRFQPRITADQINFIRGINIFNHRRSNIARAVQSGQLRAINAAFNRAPQTFNQIFQRKTRFNRHKIPN